MQNIFIGKESESFYLLKDECWVKLQQKSHGGSKADYFDPQMIAELKHLIFL